MSNFCTSVENVLSNAWNAVVIKIEAISIITCPFNLSISFSCLFWLVQWKIFHLVEFLCCTRCALSLLRCLNRICCGYVRLFSSGLPLVGIWMPKCWIRSTCLNWLTSLSTQSQVLLQVLCWKVCCFPVSCCCYLWFLQTRHSLQGRSTWDENS